VDTGSADPDTLVRTAVGAWRVDPVTFEETLAALAGNFDAAQAAASDAIAEAIEHQWARGWTPSDLAHVVPRQLTSAHGAIVVAELVADGHRRRRQRQPLHPRWLAQLDALTARAPTSRPHPPDARLRQLVEVAALLLRLPELPATVPAPGDVRNSSAAAGRLEPRMLDRVRALLAKAESTEFEDEAEALTAKAQELIARHSIDEALLHARDRLGEPSIRRMTIDDPYADAKGLLLSEVARANRCRAVRSMDAGWVTVFGYEHDLDAVEVLATSLLAQATAAMVRFGSRRDAAGRSRTRSFRRSFLLGFGQRIGERLVQTTEAEVATTSAADHRLLPVLAARDDRVEAATAKVFPEAVRRVTSVGNATGWYAGRAAADVADFGRAVGPLPEG
jgi:hypothetical protein